MPISPCISICRWEPEDNYCTGCGRTKQEKFKWKEAETSDQWKEDNINECMDRLKDWRKERFVESYEFKKQNGMSPIKAKRLNKT